MTMKGMTSYKSSAAWSILVFFLLSDVQGMKDHKADHEPSDASPMEEQEGLKSYHWTGGHKPPPAYIEENLGIYDIEIQPGDEKRIHHSNSKKLRPLDAKVKRWNPEPYKPDPDGCGFPICVLLDSIPWRFRSICQFAKFVQTGGQDHSRRIFHLQKGDCADAIEKLGHERPWGSAPKSCHYCKENEFCNVKVCWVHNDKIKNFYNICELIKVIAHAKDIISAWLGFGSCEQYFAPGIPINTEWFDIDHPCGVGDVEQSRANFIYTQNFKKTGSSRMGKLQDIVGNMVVRTIEGGNIPADQVVDILSSSGSYTGERAFCKNSRQTKKPGPPFFWPYDDIKCRDYKVRHSVKDLFGFTKHHKYIIKTPKVKTIFDECEWKPFISNSFPQDHEQEDRATAAKAGLKKHVCGLPIFNAMFIDARRRDDDTPFYETGEKLTKVTPAYGLLCSNINNKQKKKKCSDYKVRYCCLKHPPASWGPWGSWSKCSKSCNLGFRKATRVCKGQSNKHTCYGKKIRSFRERVESCNELPCPEDAIFSQWRAWSPCSTTCGLGERRRSRTCDEGRYAGKSCPESYTKYFQIEQCPKQLPCPIAIWSKWSKWNDCSATCGFGVRRRTRSCIDLHTKRELGVRMYCLGGSYFIDEKCHPQKCKIDGGWTEWQSWEECNILCGKNGKRVRRRYCAKPLPSNGGKECVGKGVEVGDCERLIPCPIHCLWSAWGEWSKCSVKCGPVGYGYRQRRRHIAVKAQYGGRKCDKQSIEETENCKHCSVKKIPHCINHCAINCEWSPWTYLGQCLSCYIEDHPPPHLKRYPAKKYRFVKRKAKYGGRKCHTSGSAGVYETKEITLDCSQVPKCPEPKGKAVWSRWSEWSNCKGICGGGWLKKRTRECIPTQKYSECQGKDKEIKKCPDLCPPKGWGEWGLWSDCSHTCGKGKITRSRSCLDPKEDGHKHCKGSPTETGVCDCGPCHGKKLHYQTEGKDFIEHIKEEYSHKKASLDLTTDAKHHSKSEGDSLKEGTPDLDEMSEGGSSDAPKPSGEESNKFMDGENESGINKEGESETGNNDGENETGNNDDGENAENKEGEIAENGEEDNAENKEGDNAENMEGDDTENMEGDNAENMEGENAENMEGENDENKEGAVNGSGEKDEKDEGENAENNEGANNEGENAEGGNAKNDEDKNAEGENAENDENRNTELNEGDNAENNGEDNVEDEGEDNAEEGGEKSANDENETGTSGEQEETPEKSDAKENEMDNEEMTESPDEAESDTGSEDETVKENPINDVEENADEGDNDGKPEGEDGNDDNQEGEAGNEGDAEEEG